MFGIPYPWPGAFLILEGRYAQTIGHYNVEHEYDDWGVELVHHPVELYKEVLTPGSTYEITNTEVWHKVQPLETTYTIMINGMPFENPHPETRTTKGKDLDTLSDPAKESHINKFKQLLKKHQP